MSRVKITRELHAEVRETLKDHGIMTTAKIHGLSPQTVSRIKRGGRSYVGYKRALAGDHHDVFRDLFNQPMTEGSMLEEPEVREPGFFDRWKRRWARH